jgi:N-acetyl-anhydromuramyl-L-alanine amidase AmpD
VRAEWGVARQLLAVVWHDMEGYLAGAIARFNTGAAGAHLAVLRDGTIVRLRPFEDVTWHAGTNNDPRGGIYGRTGFWRTHNINPYSLGVELEGFAASGYTDAQAAAVSRIADYVTAVYGVPRQRTYDAIPGHHAHGDISANRSDPGPLFDWKWVLG